MLDTFLADLRFAARTMGKHASFSAMAIGTLALAIGGNTAIFSIVDAVILRPLAYKEPGRLVAIHEIVPKFSHFAPLIPVNGMHFRYWRSHTQTFEQLAIVSGRTFNITGSGEPERIPAARVSANLFPMLGMETQIGRTFLAEEDRPGNDHVVVLDHEYWTRRFGADPGIIGRKILVDGTPYEVIGVLRADARFPKLSQLYAMTIAEDRPQIWKPFALEDSELEEMGDFNFACIGQLRRGVRLAEGLAELNRMQADFVNQSKFKLELRAQIVPLQEQITGRTRMGLELVLAAIGAVLLIGCVNIANLLLAHAAGRRREIAIRSAMGASTGRLVRQMLVESLCLSSIGGLAGVGVAYAGMRAILAYAPIDLPRMDEVRLDGRVLLFSLVLSVATGLLFGLLPAWRAARTDPQEAMRSGGRGGTAGRASGRLRMLLIGLETGLSALGLIAGGLLLHSFVKLLHVDKGFEAQHVVTVNLSLPDNRYPNLEKKKVLLESLLQRVSALPGVQSTGIASRLPLSGEGNNNLLSLEGVTVPLLERPLADVRQVNPEYFRTMGIPVLRGRNFADTDRKRQVALVSAVAAARLWPGQDAVGKRFHLGDGSGPLLEVEGVVGDIHGVSLNKKPTMTVYTPYWQSFNDEVSLVVKTTRDPAGASSAIRAEIRQVDTELPVPAFRTMDEIVSQSVAERRFQMSLVLLFGISAMLLASLGIYGVISYSVAQRTNEVGIRMALGAEPGGIAWMVLRQGLAPVAMGLAGGLAASAALGRVLGSLLFGVSAWDPLTICSVIGMLGAVAATAIYFPARRATRIDPVIALRYE